MPLGLLAQQKTCKILKMGVNLEDPVQYQQYFRSNLPFLITHVPVGPLSMTPFNGQMANA